MLFVKTHANLHEIREITKDKRELTRVTHKNRPGEDTKKEAVPVLTDTASYVLPASSPHGGTYG